MKKILVLYGGFSNECAVSLATGKEVISALKSLNRYDIISYNLTKDIEALVKFLTKEKPEAVFNALHGTYGEDGDIQGLLNLMNIAYTHSGVKSSAMAMDKFLTCQILSGACIKVPRGKVIKGRDILKLLPFSQNKVIKPVADGSSVGIYMVKAGVQSIGDGFEQWYDADLLVEDYIEGRELTVSVYNGKALCVTEILTHHEFYTYAAKYEAGGSRHILPADLSQRETEMALKIAEKTYNVMGCRGAARVDFRYDGKDFYVLEINTQPGMTSTSLMPEQMEYIGISYAEFCSMLIEQAVTDKK